MKESVNVQLK